MVKGKPFGFSQFLDTEQAPSPLRRGRGVRYNKLTFTLDLIRGSSMGWFAENLTGVPDANTNPQGRGES